MTLPFFPKLSKGMAPEKIAAMIDSVCVRCSVVPGEWPKKSTAMERRTHDTCTWSVAAQPSVVSANLLSRG